MPCTKQVFNIFKPLSDLSVPSRSLNRLGDNKDVKLVSSVSYLDWDPFHIPTSRPAAVNSLFVVQFLSVRQQSVLSQVVNQSQSVSESVSESVNESVSQSNVHKLCCHLNLTLSVWSSELCSGWYFLNKSSVLPSKCIKICTREPGRAPGWDIFHYLLHCKCDWLIQLYSQSRQHFTIILISSLSSYTNRELSS